MPWGLLGHTDEAKSEETRAASERRAGKLDWFGATLSLKSPFPQSTKIR